MKISTVNLDQGVKAGMPAQKDYKKLKAVYVPLSLNTSTNAKQ